MSKAILVMDKPSKCGECKFIRHYEDDVFERNPHCCCELVWFLEGEDYRVDQNSLDKNCPLREVPKKVDFRKAKTETVRNWIEGYNSCIDEIMKGSE